MASRLLVPVRGWEARRALRAARRRADDELATSRIPSPRLAWRVDELLRDDNRLSLARSLTDVVHSADERLLPTASPVDRAAVRECRPELLELASRLFDLARGISPRGLVLVERLLVDGNGPLYGRSDPSRLRDAAARCAEALDDHAHHH